MNRSFIKLVKQEREKEEKIINCKYKIRKIIKYIIVILKCKRGVSLVAQ